MNGVQLPQVKELVELAINEDLSLGDITSEGTIPGDAVCRAELLAKEKVRVSTLKHALDDYKKAKEKIEMFTRILEFQAEDMKAKIEKMEAKVKEKLLDQISL